MTEEGSRRRNATVFPLLISQPSSVLSLLSSGFRPAASSPPHDRRRHSSQENAGTGVPGGARLSHLRKWLCASGSAKYRCFSNVLRVSRARCARSGVAIPFNLGNLQPCLTFSIPDTCELMVRAAERRRQESHSTPQAPSGSQRGLTRSCPPLRISMSQSFS